MEEMQDKLNAILGNPQMMAQLSETEVWHFPEEFELQRQSIQDKIIYKHNHDPHYLELSLF